MKKFDGASQYHRKNINTIYSKLTGGKQDENL